MALVGHISGSSQSNSVIGISGSVIVANRPGNLFPSLPGTDVTFFVSGSTDNTATSVFGGKLVVSGGITASSLESNGNLDVGGNLTVSGDLTVNGTTTSVNTVNLEVKDSLVGLGFASGTIAQTNGDRGLIGGLATGNNVAIFWDNSESEFAVASTTSDSNSSSVSIVSYSQFHADILTGSLAKAAALSGSLTKLVDGTDYLLAGSNIVLTTGSNGSVTIAAASGVTNLQDAYDGGNTITTSGNTDIQFTLSSGGLQIEGTDSVLIGQSTAIQSFKVKTSDSGLDSIELYSTAGGIKLSGSDDFSTYTDGSIQLLSKTGGVTTWSPPSGSVQILAGGPGGVGFDPGGGEIVIESTNGFTVNTNGDMTLQMNSAANETLNIFASNAFSSTPNILMRSDGNSAINSIDITSDNNGGISIGANSLYDTGDIYIGTQETQRDIKVGVTSVQEQYVEIGSSVGASTTIINGLVTITDYVGSNILPSTDMTYNLGSSTNRFANVYTGDLHLRNDRGSWTIVEEEEYLSIRNNKTGKLYKFVLEPVGE